MDHSRRQICLSAVYGIGALLSGAVINVQGKAKTVAKERVIKIQAKKFVYTPNQIVLKQGEPVVLEFTSVDFMHGFKIPDMNIRADLPPGKVTQVRLTPDKAGEYDFLCDNFCGSGHEEMSGKITVTG
ncbi:cupredoxin domain-containing protein [Collimonas sp.]|jgi:cytochrome c oxidase subunit 2|uniref:cupredoxin domain-containing protein n=1 Tax=Collimonas sp. TaxID=1963772 RepID=UPI002C3312FB|nr:cupredoxin domain-containing protein [Collimonas sp.]HWW06311.1 cupredoxin domain-containing protein [Collimonas sp.]